MPLPVRAVWPLPPRPLVLPWPLERPWPRRFVRCLAPGRLLSVCKRIPMEILLRFAVLLFDAANPKNLVTHAQVMERFHRRLDDVQGVARTEGLGQQITNARRLDDGANAPASDDACTRRCGTQQHPGTGKFALDRVR